jgi:hypothetical protein
MVRTGSTKVSSKFEVYKFEFSMKFYFLSSSLLFQIMQTESADHAESAGDAQEKSAHSYELKFAPN